MERIDKNRYYLNIAKNIAMRGTCLKRNYGAVIVNNDEIVSTGYTGSPRGCENCIDKEYCFRIKNNIPGKTRYELCKSVHAEMNAIISASRSDMIGSTLYLSGINPDGSLHKSRCCDLCKKMIINAGIIKIICINNDDTYTVLNCDEFINDINSLKFENI